MVYQKSAFLMHNSWILYLKGYETGTSARYCSDACEVQSFTHPSVLSPLFHMLN